MSGAAAMRLAVVTPSARTLPPWICGSASDASEQHLDVAGEHVIERRHGALMRHVGHLMPVRLLNNSP
jgi:hypothetical protein